MATTHKVYGLFLKSLLNKEVDYDTDNIRAILLSSSYTFNQDGHDYVDDVRAFEIASTGGYTADGIALSGKTVAYDGATNTLKLDANDPQWAGSTFTFRYVVFADFTPGTDATRPLISCVTFDADQSVVSGTLTLPLDVLGLINLVAN